MRSKKYTKYVVIVFAVIFLISAILLFLELWERHHGEFSGSVTENDIIEYEGQKYSPKKGIETFLVMGLDKFQGMSTADSHESGVQADFLMLFVLDNEAQSCSAIHINRDTMVDVNRLAIGGAKVDTFTKQIALAYNYVADDNDKVRCRNTKDSVESLLKGIKIDHYLSLTMDSVAVINDLVGGVEVTVLDDFSAVDSSLVQGEQIVLNGQQALRYIRSRYGLENSDNIARMARQRQYINALYDKAVSCINDDEDASIEWIDAMDEYVVYDSSDYKMRKLAEKFGIYEFLGIREIEGHAKNGEEFVEFYPDEDSLMKTVTELFYSPKAD